MIGFDYPANLHARRHGPEGYEDYESYRDWLRDEFTFRCVYCLQREQWYPRRGAYHIEHFIPISSDDSGKCLYSNLLYACASCNLAKSALAIPDPGSVAFGECLRVKDNGEIETLNSAGAKLVDVLLLNCEKNVKYRSRWIRALKALQVSDPDLFQEYLSFPDNLPDLRRKRVCRNTRPEGVNTCFFVQRECGTLPATY